VIWGVGKESTMTPLYGHTSQETAYMIDDYPYGRTLRCRRRVWLEYKPNHGFRFVSQTEHPTKKVWNKPHASTYVDVAACLYLDEQGHVAWTGITPYTDATEALNFARTFGPKCEGSSRLCIWAERKAGYLPELLKESDTWAEVARLMAQK
jgi:hypothetical protein